MEVVNVQNIAAKSLQSPSPKQEKKNKVDQMITEIQEMVKKVMQVLAALKTATGFGSSIK